MANTKPKSTQGGDGLAWLLLLICLAVVGIITYRAAGDSDADAPSEVILHYSDLSSATGSTSDDLFSPGTEQPENTTSPSEETAPPLTESLGSVSGISKDDPLLVLVNRDHPLPEGKEPALTWTGEGNINVASVAYDALQAMLADGRQLGLRFVICSGYRSPEVQKQLFDEDVNTRMAQGMSYEEAWAATQLYTMPPGCSEHSTGLAVDIVSLYNQKLDSSQETTAETRWLQKHCWEYGFILRYPNDKSDITGVAYESWHYRYVGKEAARYLTENSLTLEEFHAQAT